MGWFGGVPSKVSPVKEIFEGDQQSQYLDDLPPKFEDRDPSHTKEATYGDAVNSFKISDFSFEHYVSMPCFREAMLTGFQSMGVLGLVTFFVHKSPARSANWGISGFFLGSVVGWEQCRSIRKKSFQTVEAARAANLDRARKSQTMIPGEDKALENFKRIQNGSLEK